MIDKNKDYITKSKLTIPAKALSKNNDRNRAAAKQTNKHTQTHKNQEKFSQTEKQKFILTNRRTRRRTSEHIHREKQANKQ